MLNSIVSQCQILLSLYQRVWLHKTSTDRSTVILICAICDGLYFVSFMCYFSTCILILYAHSHNMHTNSDTCILYACTCAGTCAHAHT